MGNVISSFEAEDDSTDSSRDESFFHAVFSPDTVSSSRIRLRESKQDWPSIKKKPDVRFFKHTELYKNIKALSGLPVNSKKPKENFSLTRALQKRENGIAGYPSGAFTPNQHRRIANIFLPNNREKRLMSLEAKVSICKLNKEGTRLVTAGKDCIIRIFDASKGTYHLLNRITIQRTCVCIIDVDFSPCGKYIVCSSWGKKMYFLPLEEMNEYVDYSNHIRDHCFVKNENSCLFSIRFAPHGNYIVAGGNDSHIYVYDHVKQRTLNRIKVDREDQLDINSISFLSDHNPNIILSGCNKGIIKLWDLRSHERYQNKANKHVAAFCGHFDGITYMDSRNDGNYFLSNSKDQSIKIWDARMSTPYAKIPKNLPVFYWNYLFDHVPRYYYNPEKNLEGDVSVMTYRGHRVTNTLIRAKFSPMEQTGQRYIYTGCGTGRIIVYDVLTGQIREAIQGHKNVVRDLSWHPIRPEIISGSWDSHVNLNTYKPNLVPKPESSSRKRKASRQPARRSRRLATRDGCLDDDDDDEDSDS